MAAIPTYHSNYDLHYVPPERIKNACEPKVRTQQSITVLEGNKKHNVKVISFSNVSYGIDVWINGHKKICYRNRKGEFILINQQTK